MNYRLISAAVILALYAGLGAVLLFRYGSVTDAAVWTHALTIYTSFGSMATAAASVLLGIEVQQRNVDKLLTAYGDLARQIVPATTS